MGSPTARRASRVLDRVCSKCLKSGQAWGPCAAAATPASHSSTASLAGTCTLPQCFQSLPRPLKARVQSLVTPFVSAQGRRVAPLTFSLVTFDSRHYTNGLANRAARINQCSHCSVGQQCSMLLLP